MCRLICGIEKVLNKMNQGIILDPGIKGLVNS